ncbi:MAG: hypothetical protein R2932_04565 [Caldilineaceae bacterium]
MNLAAVNLAVVALIALVLSGCAIPLPIPSLSTTQPSAAEETPTPAAATADP